MVFRRTSLSAEDFHGALDSSRAVDAGLLEMSAIWKDTSNAPVTFFFYHSYFIYIKSHHKIFKILKQRKRYSIEVITFFFYCWDIESLSHSLHNMEFCMAPRQKFKPNNLRTIHIREPTNYRVFVYSESYLSLCHCPLTMAKCITDPTIASVCAISAPRTWQTVRRKIYGA